MSRPAKTYRGARRNAALKTKPKTVWRGCPTPWITRNQGTFEQPDARIGRNRA